MTWRDWLTVAAVAIELAAALYYLWTIPHGKTRPQPVTWGGWTAIGAVGAWAAKSGGAGLTFYIAASFVAVTGAIFIVSLIPGYGHSGTDEAEPTDLPILIAGIVLLALRVVHVLPDSADVTFAVIGDSCFAWFTLRKAWNHPKTENPVSWVLASLAAAIGIVVLGSFNYTALAFPLYILVGNSLIAATVVVGRYFPGFKGYIRQKIGGLRA